MADDYRPTEPVMVYEPHGQPLPDDPADQPPPERTWKDHPLLWIAVVVAVFMAVPFFANWGTRTPAATKARSEQAASAPVAEPEQAATDVAPERSAPAVVDRPAPLPARALADPARQMVTKCVENGRVVYTQTGQCAGSVSAVPIDTSKNVVGPGAGASR